ncbi:hypothetical protein LTS18_015077 [Coniosporium uncinatum]|uniref:Uncharacterized protein n=1 Tax=Coniosporium uncinatum TaxID=93489 RepID=A0ACC3DBR3_9PEZI|nr:hypothetical protein LTS18_015077 [Coniosporium uncinatum]
MFSLNGNSSSLTEVASVAPGRTKLMAVVYNVGREDLIISTDQPTFVLHAYKINDLESIPSTETTVLGDWSALCTWKADSGDQCFFLFGKKQAKQFLIRRRRAFEIVEIQTFPVPFEASSCAVSLSAGRMYIGADDDSNVYLFELAESTANPMMNVVGGVNDGVTGLAIYVGAEQDYLLVAETDVIAVYTRYLELLGTMELSGAQEIEI